MSGDGSAHTGRPDPAGEPDIEPDVAPDIEPADAVIPPPPPETPIPDGLLASPLPPETLRRSTPRRSTPATFDDDQPAAAADDWSKPSVAPEVPTSGGYRGLTIAIFGFLFLLLSAAVVTLIFLVSSESFPFVTLGDLPVPGAAPLL